MNKTDITLVSSDGNTVISGQTTANGLVYTFKPDTPLSAKTSYTIKLNASLIDESTPANNFVTVGSFTNAAESLYMIFATEETYNGNLLAKYPNESNSTAAADRICNGSDSRPDKSVTYKAMIGSNNRWGCDANSNCGSDFAEDWVLAANTTYYNTDEKTIFTTNDSGVFDFSKGNKLTNPFSSRKSSNVWTGLTDQWQKNSNTCNDWQSNHDGKTGRAGKINTTGTEAISYTQSSCENHQSLYCVPQAKQDPIPQDSLHIFVATNGGGGFHGDLKHSGEGTSDNGTVGADNKCNISSDKPKSATPGAKYKAILGNWQNNC